MPAIRLRLGVQPLIAASGSLLTLGIVAAWSSDHSLMAITQHGLSTGWQSIALATGAAVVLALALPDARRRTQALWIPLLLAAQLAAMTLPGQYPLVAVAGLSAAASLVAIAWRPPFPGRFDRAMMAGIGIITSIAVATITLFGYETPRLVFHASHHPAAGLAAAVAATAALFLAARAAGQATWAVYVAGAAALWTLSAAILGAEQLFADAGASLSIHDHFQQGHVLVSITWVLVGLVLVILSLRGNHRGLRAGGVALLFVALGKLFLYDLTSLTAMSRAVSFIVTGLVLLLAALLLQRFASQPHSTA
jgi:hypothetical protein